MILPAALQQRVRACMALHAHVQGHILYLLTVSCLCAAEGAGMTPSEPTMVIHLAAYS